MIQLADAKTTKKPKVIKPYKPAKLCQKCGLRMAEHSDRFTCGKCSYTEFKKQEDKEKK